MKLPDPEHFDKVTPETIQVIDALRFSHNYGRCFSEDQTIKTAYAEQTMELNQWWNAYRIWKKKQAMATNAVVYYRIGSQEDPRYRFEVVLDKDILYEGSCDSDVWQVVRVGLIQSFPIIKEATASIPKTTYMPIFIQGFPPFIQHEIDQLHKNLEESSSPTIYGVPVKIDYEIIGDEENEEETVPFYQDGRDHFSTVEALVEAQWHPRHQREDLPEVHKRIKGD